MYACMTPVGFDTSDKFENHWSRVFVLAIEIRLMHEETPKSNARIMSLWVQQILDFRSH